MNCQLQQLLVTVIVAGLTVGYSNCWLQEMSTTVTDNYRKSRPRKEVLEAAPAEQEMKCDTLDN